MKKELPKVYEPQEVEGRVYEMWEKNGCFEGHRDPDKKPFTIVMPPPNVTGQLHMGHAMDCTLQDVLIRFKRMQGYAALWMPGTDHAGIATQIKVEEELRTKEGLSRYDLGREKFLERVWDWKNRYGARIVEQQKKLGVSCDWSRARFTMDEGLSKAVRHVFVEMYRKDLIYKGSRIINWCPHCVTALSAEQFVFDALDLLDVDGYAGIKAEHITGVHNHLLSGRKRVFHQLAVHLDKGGAAAGKTLHDEAFAAEEACAQFFVEVNR